MKIIFEGNMNKFLNKISTGFILAFLSVLISLGSLSAQDSTFRDQSWRFGLNLGMQSNSSALGWQQLNGLDYNFHSAPNDINYVDGTGTGFYGGLFGEYLSDSWWGVQFRISYDVRNALVDDISRTPIPSFDTKMTYVTFEPLFRVDQHLIPNLNFYAGPFLAVNLTGEYLYRADAGQPWSESATTVSKLNSLTYGVQTGVAYDIKIETFNPTTTLWVSPFIECSWLVNQKESEGSPTQNSISDAWSTVSYRAGARLSLDFSNPREEMSADGKHSTLIKNKIAVMLPADNTIYTKNVKGYFPIHPYVFFDKGSQEIPVRYYLLSKADAVNFKETDLGEFTKGDLTVKETNVNQLMTTYYQVMNIYGDRMRKNPGEDLTLRGSDPDGQDGLADANKVKSYLVETFGIDPDRIKVETEAPALPSGSAVTDPASKGLIDDENRRVTFIFDNPDMLKPIPYTIRDESSIDNDMIFSIGANIPFESWDITITGEGKTLYFGPFVYNYQRINPAELMRFLSSGTYNAKVTITEKNGNTSEENVSFKLIRDSQLKNASRYLMIFEYNQSDAVASYETKIRGEIVPGMVNGDLVYIHGHTDIIGSPDGNLKLSQERADEAKAIVDDELTKESKGVQVQAFGEGESKMQYTFDNRFPEGRMYNRNVFVEIINK